MSPTLTGIGLGANLGDVSTTLARAAVQLAALPRSRQIAISSFYRSAPVDAAGPDFLNAVLLLETSFDAHALLDQLQRIERAHGRSRPFRNAPRTLDLDLLFFGDERIATAALTVPHPRLQERAFVLRPLAEIAPHQVLPGLGRVVDLLPAVAAQRIVRLPHLEAAW